MYKLLQFFKFVQDNFEPLCVRVFLHNRGEFSLSWAEFLADEFATIPILRSAPASKRGGASSIVAEQLLNLNLKFNFKY